MPLWDSGNYIFAMGNSKKKYIYLACFNLRYYKYSVHLRWTFFPYYSANVIYFKLEINERANTLVKFSIID